MKKSSSLRHGAGTQVKVSFTNHSLVAQRKYRQGKRATPLWRSIGYMGEVNGQQTLLWGSIVDMGEVNGQHLCGDLLGIWVQ